MPIIRTTALSIAAALLSLAVATPIHASATSTASFGPVTITLIDLNPLDSIEPQVTFYSSALSPSGANVEVFTSHFNDYASQRSLGGASFKAVAATAASSLANASAAVGGAGVADGTTLVASGFASGRHPFGNPSTYSALAFSNTGVDFSLSANTEMLISVKSTLSASVGASYESPPDSQYRFATADVLLSMYGSGWNSSDGYYVNAGGSYDFVRGCSCGPETVSDARTLNVSFSNFANESAAGIFMSSVSVRGESQVHALAVPEPAAFATMSAGLLALGLLARRRTALRS